MKKQLFLILFCIPFLAFAQNIKRENINGKIIVEGNDIEGITIYNSTSNKGTITNAKGEFIIAVALYDLIEVKALEYQNIDIRVNKDILESKKVRIFLIEEINQLDEVFVRTRELTGDITTDAKSVKLFTPKKDVVYFGMVNQDPNDFVEDNPARIINTAIRSEADAMVYSLNVINVVDQLLLPLFRSEVKDKKAAGIPEVPVKSIKYYLGSSFLVENFKIPEHRVEEFIRYVEDDTFDFELLNYGHEIEFLELLNKKSKMFLNSKSKTD
ncbi:carboxypeptidase-like regulatory domain-containing protein [uncultured Dokdonia sp.]|uniref:carboxypeptidase-like regulatory domain-containing protein n=1 Tax=uncultured Dokdonia sp. TaxID=575653 RepID=UPI002626E632|nr:carboxypeptidase-like regulatory domain-containing protein [uncultured Dokdonia sp.]